MDAATGVGLWVTRPFPNDAELISIFDPVADNDVVVAGFTKFLPSPMQPVGGVVALDAATGAVRWISYFPHSDTTLQTNGVSTALWAGFVLAPSAAGGIIYALDHASGAIEWTLPSVGSYTPGCHSYPAKQDLRVVVVFGSTLYAVSDSCWLVAYDLTSHSELWRVASPAGSASIQRISTDGNEVFALFGNGQTYAFSASAPSISWIAGGSKAPFATPAAVGTDRIFVAGNQGFYAIAK